MVATWHTPVGVVVTVPAGISASVVRSNRGGQRGGGVRTGTVLYGQRFRQSVPGALAASMGGRIDLPGTAVEFGVTRMLW